MAGGELPVKKSDLGVRVVSAIGMLAVAGLAVWAGGMARAILVMLIAMGLLWEWRRLVGAFVPSPVMRGLWNVGGIIYIGFAAAMLLFLRSDLFGTGPLLCVLSMVIATDIGAYFAGRTIGGPKIAPFLKTSSGPSAFPVYHGGAADGHDVGRHLYLSPYQALSFSP